MGGVVRRVPLGPLLRRAAVASRMPRELAERVWRRVRRELHER